MPDSGNGCPALAGEDAFTYEELSRAMHFLVDAEHEAHRLYLQIARAADKTKAAEVLKDVADEERFYAESVEFAADDTAA